MLWKLIFGDFDTNIQHISGVENIVADKLSVFTSTSVDNYETSTSKAQCRANELFGIGREENNEYCFLLNILNVKREQQKELRKVKSNLSAYISDRGYGYPKKYFDDIKIICYARNIYIPQTLQRRMIYWNHLYLNHPYDSRLAKTIREVCYWKVLVTQSELYAKPCKICQQFKNRRTVYGRLTPKNTTYLKLWDTVNMALIGTYSKSIRQHQPGGAIINNNASIT